MAKVHLTDNTFSAEHVYFCNENILYYQYNREIFLLEKLIYYLIYLTNILNTMTTSILIIIGEFQWLGKWYPHPLGI
jgi:hypothetical protein